MKLASVALFLVAATMAVCAEDISGSVPVRLDRKPKYFVNPKFPGGLSVMFAAKRVFPESRQIELTDFWMSGNERHDFVVFFSGWEIKGNWEGMYWRYLAFVKKKADRSWANARVFDLPDNHPEPYSGSLESLETNSRELKAPNHTTEPASPRRAGSS